MVVRELEFVSPSELAVMKKDGKITPKEQISVKADVRIGDGFNYDFLNARVLRDFLGTGSNSNKISGLKLALRDVIENELSENHRTQIKMMYWDNLSVGEIADRLGLDGSTVSRTLKVAREDIERWLRYCMKYWR